MPTDESAQAFEKLVAARTRLTLLTKQIEQFRHDHQGTDGHYRELQRECHEALMELRTAADNFHAIVQALREEEISN